MFVRIESSGFELNGLQPMFQLHDPLFCPAEDFDAAAADVDDGLSQREIEVLEWSAAGKSDWQIAQILGVSPKTVNFHMENCKRKLRASTRMRAVVLSMRQGLITGSWKP